MNILITGGTGLIGRALCKVLLQTGHELTVLSRQPETVAEKCGASVNAIGSLTEWDKACHYDAVINLAGEPIINKAWSDARKQRLWNSRVTLTEDLVERIQAADKKPSVLLSGSAIGYYGSTDDRQIDESTSAGSDFGAQLCAAWEQAALSATDSSVRVCLLRTGLILDKNGGLLNQLRLLFKLGLGARLGHGQQWMSWIHIDDYVQSIFHLLENETITGPVNMTAPHPVTNKNFTVTLAKILHRPAFLITPAFMVNFFLGERAYLVLEGQRVIPVKLTQNGYEFIYPHLSTALEYLLHADHLHKKTPA